MPETTETRVDPVDLRAAARHVMVDFNQMQTFSANPLIMVEGNGTAPLQSCQFRYL